MEIEGCWNQKLFIHRWELEDIEEWNAFVKLLEYVRGEILKDGEKDED